MSTKGKFRIWTLDVAKSRCEVVGACWLWKQGLHKEGGQPMATIHGKSTLVRRWVLEQVLGRPIATGMRAGARCNDPLCISPHHVYERTHGDTVRQAYAEGKRGGARETVARRRCAVASNFTTIDMAAALELRQRVFGLTKPERCAEVRKFAAERGISAKWAGEIATGRRGWKVDEAAANSVFNVGAAA